MHNNKRCIPVERDQRGFTVSSEWIESDLSFPTIESLNEKLKKNHEVIEDDIFYDEEFVPASIYIFEDEYEIPLAVLKSSEISEKNTSDGENIYYSYLNALRNRVSFTEYVLPEQENRLDAIFIQPSLSSFNDPEGKRFLLSRIEDEPRILLLGAAGAGKTTLLRKIVKMNIDSSLYGSNEKIPVYIQCRNFYEYTNIEDAILQNIKETLNNSLFCCGHVIWSHNRKMTSPLPS